MKCNKLHRIAPEFGWSAKGLEKELCVFVSIYLALLRKNGCEFCGHKLCQAPDPWDTSYIPPTKSQVALVPVRLEEQITLCVCVCVCMCASHKGLKEISLALQDLTVKNILSNSPEI